MAQHREGIVPDTLKLDGVILAAADRTRCSQCRIRRRGIDLTAMTVATSLVPSEDEATPYQFLTESRGVQVTPESVDV